MRVLIVTPAPAGSRAGNRKTATRWARLLRSLGHRVEVATAYRRQRAGAMIALHSRKSHDSIARFAGPTVVVLPGTDIYGRHDARVLDSMARATRLLVLQPLARRRVPKRFHSKLRVIVQSAEGRARRRGLDVCVLGHLRDVKDPFRAALAARRLPADSRLRVVHYGAALSPAMARRARAEVRRNPRYRWFGERGSVHGVLSRARAMVISSRLEGGANVVSEAIACGTPILASRVDGNVGLLGRGYPGYFRYGDTAALARLMRRVEVDGAWLTRAVARLRPTVSPARERAAWRRLLAEL